MGLSYPVGMGISSLFMFGLDLAGISITVTSVNIFNLLLILFLLILNRHKILFFIKEKQFRIRISRIDLRSVNYFWWFMLILLIIIVGANVMRNSYWPVYTYDSVAGYDLSAKIISAEGKLITSLFDHGINLKRGVYPPLSSTAFAIPYMLGMESSKLTMSFFYISLLLSFYGFLLQYVNKTNALFFSLLLAITPELFGYSVLSNTNMPSVIYIGIGGLFFCRWFEERALSDCIIAGLLLGFNVWLRSDGIVFNIAVFLILLFDFMKLKTIKPLLIMSFLMLTPFIIWNLYLRFNLGIVTDRFVDKMFWDPTRLRIIGAYLNRIIFSINLWGLNCCLFLVALIVNFKKLKSKKVIVPIFYLLSLFLYLIVFYHLDPIKQDPIQSMMNNSFRRGYMVYMPLFLFYAADKTIFTKLFDRINQLSHGNSLAK